MKQQILAIISILCLTVVVLVLIHTRENPIICNTVFEPYLPCKGPSPFPNEDALTNTTLNTYRLKDNCRLQNLAYQVCDNFGYSILGRFHGKQISEYEFMVDSIEVKSIIHRIGLQGTYEIGGINIKPNSNKNHHILEIELTNVPNEGDEPKVYKFRQAFILNKDALLEFVVEDMTSDEVMTTMKCVEGDDESNKTRLGGYECIGIISF